MDFFANVLKTVNLNLRRSCDVVVHGGRTYGRTEFDTIPLKNIAFIRVFYVEPMQSTQVARVFTLG